MKLCQLNDPHLCEKAPRNRTDEYFTDTVVEIFSAIATAKDNDCEAMLLPGDLFHIPAASRVPHSLVSAWLTLFSNSSMPSVFITPGNHDLSAGRIDSLESQPIGILGYHPKVTILHSGQVSMFNGITIRGIEWNYQMSKRSMKAVSEVPTDILITHAPITHAPNPFYSTIQPDQLQGIASIVAYGHIHKTERPVKIGDTIFSNPGALSRGSISEDDVNRTPSVAIIDTTDLSVDYIPIKHKPPEDIYRATSIAIKRTSEGIIQAFIDNLNLVDIESTTVDAVLEAVNAHLADERAKALAEEIIRSVS
jgi:DNA repair exonuclease SbcCD nuclease subunit